MKKTAWNDLSTLPNDDHYVLWKYENGSVIYADINHDMDDEDIKYFLSGYKHTGPIVGWMEIPE